MPTGYTSEIYNGKNISRNDFILNCARAFGALINLRDKPSGEKWTLEDLKEKDTYHTNRINDIQAELDTFLSLSDAAIGIEKDAKYNNEMIYYQSQLEKINGLQSRYESMIKQIKEWNPPTDDHEQLKTFMFDQLESSIKFDCYEPTLPKKNDQTVAEYRAETIKNYNVDLKYHQKHLIEDNERNKNRIEWASALLESLK